MCDLVLMFTMGYPQFLNKHLEKILFHPDDYVSYRYEENKTFPKNGVCSLNNMLHDMSVKHTMFSKSELII